MRPPTAKREAGAGGSNGARGWLRELSVPLTIAVVAGLLTAGLLPRILRRSEDHRRALELQTALAQEMGTSIAAVTTTGRLIARNVIAKEQVNGQTAFDNGLRDWEIASASVESELSTYYFREHHGQPSLAKQWIAFSNAVESLYFLSGTGLKDQRCLLTQTVKNYLTNTRTRDLSCWSSPQTERRQADDCRTAATTPPWTALAACDGDNPQQYLYARGGTYRDAYVSTSQRMQARGRTLIRAMVETTPAGF